MSLAPLTDASVSIQVHAWAAMLALIVGTLILVRRKGNQIHRWTGRIWVGLMVLTTVSSFFIHELKIWGQWSPIHLLSIVTLVLLARALIAIRNGQVKAHANRMKSAFFGALILAGVFTLAPGRIMNEVIFGPPSGDQTADAQEIASGFGAIPLWAWIIAAVIAVGVGRRAIAWIGIRSAK